MKFQTKEIILKNGKKAALRNAVPEDALEMAELQKKISGETDFLMRYPEECVDMDEEGERNFLKERQDSNDSLILVCEIDGKISGSIALKREAHIKTKHRGSIGIGVLKKYWNMGIGTLFVEEIIKISEDLGIKQLELGVFEGNERGRALYRKMGFVQAGYLPDAVCLKDGRMLKEYTMIKKL